MPLTIDHHLVEQLDGPIVLRLRDIINEFSQTGRYVQEIMINGSEVTVQSVIRSDFQCNEEDDVRLVTCSFDELIHNTMESSFEVAPKLHKVVKKAVEEMRSARQETGVETLATVIDLLEWHVNVLSTITQFHPGPSTVHELNYELQEVISRMHQAWGNEDYILLTDILEYELLPWLERWYATVDLYKKQMALEGIKRNRPQ